MFYLGFVVGLKLGLLVGAVGMLATVAFIVFGLERFLKVYNGRAAVGR